LLRADNVSFAYGRADAPPVIDQVTADIARGGVVGILGPNGSGKTTLLRLLSGTRRPSRGQVLLEGARIDRLSRRAVAQRIAVVPQETQLAFEYTVIELVLMGRHPHLGLFEIEGPDDLVVAREALRATATAHLEHRPFSTLSGGEKQRVVIASALAQAPDILILDEPTASLDLGYQLEIASLLAALNQERGVTIVISTHDLNLAAAVCRDVIMLRAGRVLAAGATREVVTAERIAQLYGVRADIRVNDATGQLLVVPVSRLAADASDEFALQPPGAH
jgi:iron complex transport system ATP-binding protein